MAEFCLDCFHQLNETNDDPEKYVLSKDLELCEGCGEWKHVVVTKHKSCGIKIFKDILFRLKFFDNICFQVIVLSLPIPLISWESCGKIELLKFLPPYYKEHSS